VLRECSVFISGHNFRLFALRKCSVFISGRNFGLFVLRECSVFISGRNFGLFVLGKLMVDAILVVCPVLDTLGKSTYFH
jgi:hypothetical protein